MPFIKSVEKLLSVTWRIERIQKHKGISFLSRLERERFNVLAGELTVKDAAQKLGLAPGTLYNWLDNERRILIKERGHINALLGQMRRGELLRKELSIRRSVEPLEEELKEEPE